MRLPAPVAYVAGTTRVLDEAAEGEEADAKRQRLWEVDSVGLPDPLVTAVAASMADVEATAARPVDGRQLCHFFARGSCAFGQQCRFRHYGGPELEAGGSGAQPCVFFAQGRCNRGAACTFSHDTAGVAVAGQTPPLCSFYLRGQCLRGRGCLFSHGNEGRPEPCRHFAAGHCRNGGACPFEHTPGAAPGLPAVSAAAGLQFFDAEGKEAEQEAPGGAAPRTGRDILRKYSASSLAWARGHEVRVKAFRGGRGRARGRGSGAGGAGGVAAKEAAGPQGAEDEVQVVSESEAEPAPAPADGCEGEAGAVVVQSEGESEPAEDNNEGRLATADPYM